MAGGAERWEGKGTLESCGAQGIWEIECIILPLTGEDRAGDKLSCTDQYQLKESWRQCSHYPAIKTHYRRCHALSHYPATITPSRCCHAFSIIEVRRPMSGFVVPTESYSNTGLFKTCPLWFSFNSTHSIDISVHTQAQTSHKSTYSINISVHTQAQTLLNSKPSQGWQIQVKKAYL